MFPTAQRHTELHKQIRLTNDYNTKSVRECFYWPKHVSNSYKVEHRIDAKAPKNYYQKPQTKPIVRFSDELDEWDGRYSVNRNESSNEFNNQDTNDNNNDISSYKTSPNTVSNALRGWPNTRNNENSSLKSYVTNGGNGMEDGDTRIYDGQVNANNIIASNSLPEYMFKSDCDYALDDRDDDVIFYDYESEKNNVNKSSAVRNNKTENRVMKNNRGDVTIRDLLSYRYHREHKIEEAREKKEEEQREKQKSKEKYLKNKRMAGLKANKTSQLRAIELSKKTNEAKNEEMWKMKKFREVPSKISSLKNEKQNDSKTNEKQEKEDDNYSPGLQVNYKEELDDITYTDYHCDEEDILDFDSLKQQLYVS